jgi:hypothetical protein
MVWVGGRFAGNKGFGRKTGVLKRVEIPQLRVSTHNSIQSYYVKTAIETIFSPDEGIYT